MPSGWDVYYVVFLSALLALGIPAALRLISFLVAARQVSKQSPPNSISSNKEEELLFRRRINTRFFLSINAALLLITLGLSLIPLTGSLQSNKEVGSLIKGVVSIVSLACLAILGLLYSFKKGDLSWLLTFRKDSERDKDT